MATKRFVLLTDTQDRALYVRADVVHGIQQIKGTTDQTMVSTPNNAFYVKHKPASVKTWVEDVLG